MKKNHLSEELLFTTALITCACADGTTSFGSGLFYRFFDGKMEDFQIPALITNKHVVEDALKIELAINTIDKNGEFDAHNHVIHEIKDLTQNIINHPDPDVDLCAILITPLITEIEASGRLPYIVGLNESFFLSENEIKNLTALENIVMVGYPTGISDEYNNLPIIRKGITATPIYIDYNNKKEFLIDASCFPGSSGSPVFLYREDVVKDGETFAFKSSIKLLGILCAGPEYPVEGEIRTVIELNLTKQISLTNILINLGHVIKVERILELEAVIKKELEIT